MARKGQGRRTKQYNAGGAKNLSEWVEAALDHTRGAHDAGGAIIHATPEDKRRAFNDEVWRRRRARSNPADEAAEAFEDFHGHPSEGVIDIEEEIHVHRDLADVGELIELEIYALDEGRLICLQGFEGARLVMNEDRNQLYVRGGDQSVDIAEFGIDEETMHESEVLGVLFKGTYYTRKDHLGNQGGIADYVHEFGEENGEMPYVIYDTRSFLLSFSGGSYTIEPEGIRN